MTNVQGKRTLAIASGGGHWLQLQQLREALEGQDVTYVCVHPQLAEQVPEAAFYAVEDATREEPLDLLKCAWQVLRLVVRIRPQVVLSTGAAPGLFGLVFGKLLGARTVWIDSVANVETLSLSGRLVRPFADVRLTQWKHLAGDSGTRYEGSVL